MGREDSGNVRRMEANETKEARRFLNSKILNGRRGRGNV